MLIKKSLILRRVNVNENENLKAFNGKRNFHNHYLSYIELDINIKRSRYMERLTRALDSNNLYVVDHTKVQHDVNGGYTGDAISKLAKFENFYDDLLLKQSKISKELEELRLEDKKHSVKFKQLFANKMTNNNVIIILKSYGLE